LAEFNVSQVGDARFKEFAVFAADESASILGPIKDLAGDPINVGTGDAIREAESTERCPRPKKKIYASKRQIFLR
jgi:hypothetical protein